MIRIRLNENITDDITSDMNAGELTKNQYLTNPIVKSWKKKTSSLLKEYGLGATVYSYHEDGLFSGFWYRSRNYATAYSNAENAAKLLKSTFGDELDIDCWASYVTVIIKELK